MSSGIGRISLNQLKAKYRPQEPAILSPRPQSELSPIEVRSLDLVEANSSPIRYWNFQRKHGLTKLCLACLDRKQLRVATVFRFTQLVSFMRERERHGNGAVEDGNRHLCAWQEINISTHDDGSLACGRRRARV